jgi:hypothetical protein
MAAADRNAGLVIVHQHTAGYPRQPWIRDATPQDGAAGVAASVVATVRLGRALEAASVAGGARLEDARGAPVAGTAAYDALARTLSFDPTGALPAGGYVLRLDGLRDGFGARPPAGLAVRFTVGAATDTDTAPPDTGIVSAPTGISRSGLEPFTRVFSSEPLVTFQCSFDSGPWAPCAPDKPSGADMPNGARTFRVRAVDGAGRADPTPAVRTWTIDHFGAAPPNDTVDGAVVLSGASGSVESNTHRADLEQAPSEDNGGGRSVWFRWTAPAGGTATFDTAGSAFDTLLGVFVDEEPTVNGPLVRRASDDDAGPGTLTSRVQMGVRAGTTYWIAVDGFADPVHAQSGAVTLNWSLAAAPDSTAPQTTITDGPPSLVTAGTSDFAFAASEPGATFECALGAGAFFPCDSPVAYEFALGEPTLRVRATDAAGNTDATPATWRWSVDKVPPEVRFTATPGVSTSARTVSFEFEADEPGVSFECRVDRGLWGPCSSPRTVTVASAGPHELDVRGTDPAGHTGEYTRALWVVLEDSTAPRTSITAGPAPVSRMSAVRLSFISSEPGGFRCRLDAGSWTACSSPAVWSGLPAGTHTVSVRAHDAAGNVDATPARRTFTVDPAAPILGDFDADGRPDLAVGMPGEATAGQAAGGAVLVLPGGSAGPAAAGAQLWSQNAPGVPDAAEAGDRFGSALAAGDFDADGYDDLAVGAPGENGGAGAVHVLRGSRSGLTTALTRVLTQGTPGLHDDPASGDRFGAALAAARFDADETEDLAIGVPGESVAAPDALLAGAGAVHVVPGTAGGLSGRGARAFHRATNGVTGDPGAGDGFGTALAAGDLGGGQRADLAVGVPDDAVGGRAGAGAVHALLAGGSTGIGVTGDSLWTQDTPGIPDAVEPGDRFGAALAIGALGSGGPGDLAVGVPGEGLSGAARAGAVAVLYGGASGPSATGAQLLHQDSPGMPGAVEAGDGFGASLATTRPRGSAPWLGVAAPDEDAGTAADAGWVVALRATDDPLGPVGSRVFEQGAGGLPDLAEAGDRFGAELGALGAGLALGAQTEDVGALADAGAVVVLRAGSGGGPEPSGSVLWHQDVAGVPGVAAAGDRLGVLPR